MKRALKKFLIYLNYIEKERIKAMIFCGRGWG
jgi:hypothetical protein